MARPGPEGLLLAEDHARATESRGRHVGAGLVGPGQSPVPRKTRDRRNTEKSDGCDDRADAGDWICEQDARASQTKRCVDGEWMSERERERAKDIVYREQTIDLFGPRVNSPTRHAPCGMRNIFHFEKVPIQQSAAVRAPWFPIYVAAMNARIPEGCATGASHRVNTEGG